MCQYGWYVSHYRTYIHVVPAPRNACQPNRNPLNADICRQVRICKISPSMLCCTLCATQAIKLAKHVFRKVVAAQTQKKKGFIYGNACKKQLKTLCAMGSIETIFGYRCLVIQ